MYATSFADTVSRIIHRVACTEGHEGEDDDDNDKTAQAGGGPLTAQELSDLSLLCTTAAAAATSNKKNNNNSGFGSVEGDQLLALLELLDRHIDCAAGVNLIHDAWELLLQEGSPSLAAASLDKWLKPGAPGHDKLVLLRMGLETAAIILFITTSPGVDRRAVNEDAIQAAISLMRQHLRNNLIPAFNQTGHLSSSSSVKSLFSNNNNSDAPPSPLKKRRRSSNDESNSHTTTDGAAKNQLKKVYKHLFATVHLQILLMERIEHLVENLPLDDQQILLLTNGVLPALEIDSSSSTTHATTHRIGGVTSPLGQQLQLAAIAVCTAAFYRYPMHRDTMLEDLFPVMLTLPTGKRSLRTYALRYSSAAAADRLAALNATAVGQLLSSSSAAAGNNDDVPRCISAMTALVLSLVQACVRRPMYERIPDDDDQDADNKDNKQEDEEEEHPTTTAVQHWSSGLRDCQTVVDRFCDDLLTRCAHTKNGRAALEFRPVLTHLVEDLLAVLLIPEFPAAELLLCALTVRLLHDLTLASPTLTKKTEQRRIILSSASSSNTPVGGGQAPESTYMTVAFDALGKIFAVQARILALQSEKDLRLVTDTTSHVPPMSDQGGENHDDDTNIRLQCYCQSDKREHQLLVGCDRCQTFFHGRCVGVTSKSDVPATGWYCDSCRLKEIVAREERKQQGHGTEAYIDAPFAVRLAFQASLAHRLGVVGLEAAKQFHLARWMDDLEKKHKDQGWIVSPQKIVGELLEFWDSPGPTGEVLTEEGGNRAILFLASKTTPLMLTFRNQMRFVLELMSDNSSHTLRKLSLKAIEKTVEGDPNLMLLPIITKSVSSRLTDESISVREAAVSLVGSYVVLSPAVASTFHSSLLACLTDTGISVRKRAVKIFQSILTSNPAYKGRSSVCEIMLQRAADPKEEDAVRDLIDGLFCQLWLQNEKEDNESPDVATVEQTGATPVATSRSRLPRQLPPSDHGVVTPTPPAVPRQVGRLTQKRSDLAAEHMMEVVRSAGTTVHLEALLKKLLGTSAEDGDKGRMKSDRKKRQDLDSKQCEKIVASLFELLISVEEDRDSQGPPVGKDLAATLQTIAVFAQVSPESVFCNIDTVLPYLKADNSVSMNDEAHIVAAASDIIYRLALTLGQRVVDRLGSTPTAKDLVQITYKFGPGAFMSAIRAFSCLARSSGSIFAVKLLELGRTFYTFLCKRSDVEDFSKVDHKTKNNVHRALTVLGFICQYHVDGTDTSKWDEEIGSEEIKLVQPQHLDWSNLMLACFRLFSTFLQKDDSDTKCSALRALGGIFVSKPRLMLQLDQEGLIKELMSNEAGTALQLESLKCWCNILEAEEKRIDEGHAKSKMDSNRNITVSNRISGDLDGDATLFGGVLTNHAEHLFQMTKSREPTIRLAVLKVLGLLLRQGLVNPNEAVPHLIALQGDIEKNGVRSLALKLLSAEGEKRPDTLRRRICVGVQHAYEFQKAVATNNQQVSAIVVAKNGKGVECIFSKVFKECIASIRKERHGFLKSLLSLFKLRVGPKSSKGGGKDLALLSFASQILAHLEYGTLDDPLFVIHEISSMVTLQGSEILDQFAAVLRPLGLSGTDDCDDDNTEEDALERAARSKFPSRTNEARPLSSKAFNLPVFVDHCCVGMALCLLLRLKSFLRRVYSLSETRCLEYNPTNTERISDKGSAKAEISKPFDASIPRVLLQSKGPIDIDALIRHYAEFRRLMREESNVDMGLRSSSSDEDEEEPVADAKRKADKM